MFDEHAEAAFVDLRLHFGFDLVAWMGYEVPGSAATIAAMLRGLPEGSTLGAIMSAPKDDAEPNPLDPDVEQMLDRKTWTTVTTLLAQQNNTLNLLARHLIQWDGDAPDFPIIGPASWREGSSKPAKPSSVLDFMAGMGFAPQTTDGA